MKPISPVERIRYWLAGGEVVVPDLLGKPVTAGDVLSPRLSSSVGRRATHMRFAQAILLVGVLSAIQSAMAQPHEAFESIEIACASAPAGAKTELPPKLAEWAVVSCTRYGHVVRAAPGWVWHSPHTNEFVRIWSQPSPANLEATGHADHFTALEFRQLAPDEANEASEALAAQLGAKPQPAADAYVLLMRDIRGQTQAIHFVRTEANLRLGNFWAWACRYPCVKPQVFMGFKPR